MVQQPQQVEIQEGVVYGHTDGIDLQCDVFKPTEPLGPGILLLHGGGYAQGSRAMMRGYGIQMGRRGYTCVSASYRLTDVAPWPAQQRDVEAAIAWMQANHISLGIDPSKLVLWGNSAGGHMALLLSATLNNAAAASAASRPVAAAIGYYPITVYEAAMGTCWTQFCPPMFPGGGSAQQWHEISPLTHASANCPPTLLLHGATDEIVVASQSTRYFDALERAKVPVELHIYAGQPHAFDFDRTFALHTLDVAALFIGRYVP